MSQVEYNGAYIHRSHHLGAEVKDWLRDYEQAENQYIHILKRERGYYIACKLRGAIYWDAEVGTVDKAIAIILKKQWG